MVGRANAFAVDQQVNLANATAGLDNADMGAVATQLSADQVKQQLATLATSIANRSHASVLQLFKQGAG
jgi:flagellin-like hook-associated protein FlgL